MTFIHNKSRSVAWSTLALTSILVLTGCPEDAEVSTAAVYHGELRPIIDKHCASCHSSGSLAPFNVGTYEEVVAWAPAMMAAVEARIMPPHNINNDGTCHTFVDANWLTDEEIGTFRRFVEGGYKLGDPTIPRIEPEVLAVLTGDDLQVVDFGTYTTTSAPESPADDYQCFRIPLELAQDKFLVGYEVLAENINITHHLLGFRVVPTDGVNQAQMDTLEAEHPGVGWDCYGAAGENVIPSGVPVTWAPGTGATEFPEGTGMRFSPGDVLVVQVHYYLPNGAGATDATAIKLKWADSVEREAFQFLYDPFLYSKFSSTPASLEPGQEAASYRWVRSFKEMLPLEHGEGDIDLIALTPHMHKRGRTMAVSLRTPESADPTDTSDMSTSQCLADVDRWDFNWQRSFFYTTPIRVPATYEVEVECQWDTRDSTEPVLPGFGTNNEMCLLGLMYTIAL